MDHINLREKIHYKKNTKNVGIQSKDFCKNYNQPKSNFFDSILSHDEVIIVIKS